MLRKSKRGSHQAKKKKKSNQDQMKGINEDQWEDDKHDKDFSTRVNDGSCGKIFQRLNLKYCILGETS